jgi:serine/threonine-protein kinase
LLDGRYRLDAYIGEGGMGRVYAGVDIRLDRKVAIKVMHTEGADATLVERLFREAKAAARTDHPGVVRTFGYGTDIDLNANYIVMERLRGENLEQRLLRTGRMSAEELQRITLEIADALIAVHELEIVHRDLKPSNVFLASRGRRVDEVVLLDFGIAKHLDLLSLTVTGQIFGTLPYMAPEQLRNSKAVDARCDLYSLGAMMFECATLQLPYRAPNPVVLVTQHMVAPEPDLASLRPDLPAKLTAVIQRCLKRDLAERFQNASAVYTALATEA